MRELETIGECVGLKRLQEQCCGSRGCKRELAYCIMENAYVQEYNKAVHWHASHTRPRAFPKLSSCAEPSFKSY